MAPEATPVNPPPTSTTAPQNEPPKQQNQPVAQESKSARKKRLQREKQASVDSTKASSSNASGDSNNPTVANGHAAAAAAAATTPIQEPAALKELQKQLRNVTKKLNGMAKLDATVAENPDKSLDQLVEEKLINLDQKAQALKKPSLQASAAQIEEQIAQFKSYAAYYEALLEKQKSESANAHKEELAKVRDEVEKATTEKCEQDFNARLLTLSQFLCAAARMRQAGESNSNESRAFEGVLLQVYSGTDDAVKSMMKLINGVEENIRSVEGDEVNVTYGHVKSASAETAPVPQVYTEVQQEATVTETEAEPAPVSTVAEQTTVTEEVAAAPAPAEATTEIPPAAETVTATTVEETTVAVETAPAEATPAEAAPTENTSVEVVAQETVTTEANAAAPAESADNAAGTPTPSQPRAHNNRGRGGFRGNRGGFYRGGRGGGFSRGGERGGRGRGGFRGGRGRGGYHQQRDSNGQPSQQQPPAQAPAQQ